MTNWSHLECVLCVGRPLRYRLGRAAAGYAYATVLARASRLSRTCCSLPVARNPSHRCRVDYENVLLHFAALRETKDLTKSKIYILMNRAKIFKNGDSQAVRLPKEYRFKGKEVYIHREGENVVLTPINDAIDGFWNTLNKFSNDLKIERDQPKDYDKRDPI